VLALALMWAYDLHLYTLAYFTHGLADDLIALRGAVPEPAGEGAVPFILAQRIAEQRADRPRALAEIRRMLHPGGKLCQARFRLQPDP